jgi:hypothetical protein
MKKGNAGAFINSAEKLFKAGKHTRIMAYSKRFPRSVKGSPYAQWEEITISDDEEKQIDEKARADNIRIFSECIDDAKRIVDEKGLKGYETTITAIAVALFEKRASHSIYWKEKATKEKFDAKSG